MKKRAISEQAKLSKKQLMLSSALDVFYEKGFTAARMEDIANRCGISKGTLYLYFKSKDAVFNSLIDNIAKPNQVKIIEMISAAPSAKDAIIAMTEFIPIVIEQGKLPRLLKILIGDSGSFPEIIKSYKKDVIEQALKAMNLLFQRSNQSGETRINEPHLFSRLVVAPIIFSAIWKAVFAGSDAMEYDLSKFFKLHQKIIINAMQVDLEDHP